MNKRKNNLYEWIFEHKVHISALFLLSRGGGWGADSALCGKSLF